MYVLIKIKPTGMRVTLAAGMEKDALVAAAKSYTMLQPEYEFGVIEV